MGQRGVWKRSSVVEKKLIEVERRPNAAIGGKISITERGPKGVFNVLTSEGGGRWLGKLLCEVSSTPIEWKRYSDNQCSIVGISKENRQGRFLETLFTNNQSGNRAKILRLPAGKSRNGWADVGLCLLDLFMPGVREGKEVESDDVCRQVQQKKTLFQHTHFRKPFNNVREAEKQQNGDSKLLSQLTVGIGGVFNRNTITHYSWWESSVFCYSNSKMSDWEWVRKRAEEIVGVVDIRVLGEKVAVFDTKSRELAWNLQNVQFVEGYGSRMKFMRWTPECGGIMKGELEEKNRWVKLCGVPYHLRFEEAIKKLIMVFCLDFEWDINPDSWWRREQIRVRVKGVRLEDIPRVMFVEERGYRFPLRVVLEEEEEDGTIQRGEEKLSKTLNDGGGDRVSKKIASELSGRGENDPTIQDGGKAEVTAQVKAVDEKLVEYTQMQNMYLGPEWIKVSGNSKPTNTTENRSWVEIVKPNKYEVLEVVDLEAQSMKEKQACEPAEPSHRYKPKTSGMKLGSAPSFNSVCPSLKLSRRLWPIQKTGKRERLSRVKRLARQALEKENSRNWSKEQQGIEDDNGLSDSDFSVSSTMAGNKQEPQRKGKAVQKLVDGEERVKNKAWVKKEFSADKNKTESGYDFGLGSEHGDHERHYARQVLSVYFLFSCEGGS
ncbi:hypothetical protein FRX31_018340 [Thalictrum thalictroides]|uniref:DUF4283 domain-containing protein n=1 Tax=Thalictrum thalictroides TaxID=46969 RepID=A0A7J6W4S7_THATH|nr:hypothetical protein FRX31_018340 [Thalictrum thalictroides]